MSDWDRTVSALAYEIRRGADINAVAARARWLITQLADDARHEAAMSWLYQEARSMVRAETLAQEQEAERASHSASLPNDPIRERRPFKIRLAAVLLVRARLSPDQP